MSELVPVPIGPGTLLGIEIISPTGQRTVVNLAARSRDAGAEDSSGLTLTGATATFEVTVRLAAAIPDTGRCDLRITLRHRGTELVEASVRLRLDLP